jgi:hypothetical protein
MKIVPSGLKCGVAAVMGMKPDSLSQFKVIRIKLRLVVNLYEAARAW